MVTIAPRRTGLSCSSEGSFWTTKHDVDPRTDAPGLDDGALAPVISLVAARARAEADQVSCDEVSGDEVSGDEVGNVPEDAVGRDGALLGRLYGERWHDLPSHLGRVAAGLERLLERGPTAIDPSDALPGATLSNAWLGVRAASAHAPIIADEAEVLAEALGASLTQLPLDQLGRVASAVLALAAAGGAEAAWADRADVDAARSVLDAHGADLREAAELHRQVYERFTERVWEIRSTRLDAGTRRRGVLRRRLLRLDLLAARRTEALQGSVRSQAQLILRAREARRRLVTLAPLLERHLGRRWRGPLTDVAPIVRSQDALRQLHRALGDQLDVDRLRDLLLADAFTSDELTACAMRLTDALRAWEDELTTLSGGNPWALPADDLARWAADTGGALVQLMGVLVEMSEHGGEAVPLRTVVDVLLLREHAEEQAGGHPIERAEDPPDEPATEVSSQSQNASSL